MLSRAEPPHSSGTSMPQQPRAPSLWMASRGKWSVRSQSLTCARTSVDMKLRTVSRMRSWWSEREKSMAGGKFSMGDGFRRSGGGRNVRHTSHRESGGGGGEERKTEPFLRVVDFEWVPRSLLCEPAEGAGSPVGMTILWCGKGRLECRVSRVAGPKRH